MSISALIWSIADFLRGDYKQSDYGKIILPFTLLRRLECVLEPTREAVLVEFDARKNLNVPMEQFLVRKSNNSFCSSRFIRTPSQKYSDSLKVEIF